MLNWDSTPEEAILLKKVAQRTVKLAKKHGVEYKLIDALMDVTACHLNGNPLDLERMLKADEFNFAHDVFGIRGHLDRKSGKLNNCFVPRLSDYRKKPVGEILQS